MDETASVDTGGEPQDAESTASSEATAEEQTPDTSKTASKKPSSGKTEIVSEEESEEGGKIPYDRFKQVNDEKRAMEAQIKELQEKAEKFDRIRTDPSYAEGIASVGGVAQRDPVVEQADKQLKEMGYVKAEEVAGLVDAKVNEQIEAARLAEKFLELESQHDGSDGAPKFEANEMFDYMTNNGTLGTVDPEVAYEIRYKDELADARAKEIKSTPHSETRGPSEQASGDDRASKLEAARKSGDFSDLMKDTNLFRGWKRQKGGDK